MALRPLALHVGQLIENVGPGTTLSTATGSTVSKENRCA